MVNVGGAGDGWGGLSRGQFTNKREHQISHSLNGSVTKIHGNWTFQSRIGIPRDAGQLHRFRGGFRQPRWMLRANDVGNYTAQYINATGQPQGQFSVLRSKTASAAQGPWSAKEFWFVRPGANLKPAYASKYFAVYSQND